MTDSTVTIVSDSSEAYGLDPKFPIKVKGLAESGPASQRAYLERLRDAQGKSVKYERLGSCCAYRSANGFGGYAMVDRYKVVYRDERNKRQSVVIHLSFYDFETPRAVKGFTLTD